jgi:hypothetical protein
MTVSTHRGYVFTIEYRPEPVAYQVDFPDIPEIITSGSTLTEAVRKCLRGARSAPGKPTETRQALPKVKRRMVLQ